MKRIALVITAFITLAMLNESQAQSTKVLMKTTMGDITLMLYDDTPIHKDNFIKLVKEHFYDGLLFHRVIPQFMIQAGDPTSKDAKPGQQLGSGNPGYTLPAEFRPGHWHMKGALAAARLNDQANPTKASSGSQFYIVVGKPWSLNDLSAMERQGMHPKFTEEQKKVYTSEGGYPPLDYQYTVFGEVVKGMDVVEKISKVPRNSANRPNEDVKILSVSVIK
jgi:cyclophilin family peptidyl-prolyl cis-trans isomerase